MFIKTTILVLLMMQWKYQDITAEAQDIDSKITELSNDFKQLVKFFEKCAKTTEDKMRELRGEENFQLSILTGQQRALENKIDAVKNNQDDVNQALGQLRQNHDEMKQGQSQIKQALSQMTETQNTDHTKINSISDAIKKLSCQLTLPSLKTQFINGKRYYMSYNEPLISWPEAENFCKSHGMDLVTIETQQEWDVLKPEIEKLDSKVGAPWSSGSDAAQDGMWKWTTTGSDVTFFAKLYSNDNDPDENCLYLYTEHWDDYPCSEKRSFICEQNILC